MTHRKEKIFDYPLRGIAKIGRSAANY